jgi:hypothetical protein
MKMDKRSVEIGRSIAKVGVFDHHGSSTIPTNGNPNQGSGNRKNTPLELTSKWEPAV